VSKYLRLCTIFRQIWTIRGSDTEVYPFSKCWRPLFWIFVIGHLITWPASYACDSASSLQISSQWDNMQLSYSRKVFFNAASIRHFEFANFWIFVTFPSPWSKFASAFQISSNSDDSRQRYGDITIFKMAAVRHVGFSKFDILITKPLYACDYASSFQISS